MHKKYIRTDFYVDGIRRCRSNHLFQGILDSFFDTRICDESIAEEHQVTLSKTKQESSFYFGQEQNNKPKGHGILFHSDGSTYLAKWDQWGVYDLGNYVYFKTNKKIGIGEMFLDESQNLQYRKT